MSTLQTLEMALEALKESAMMHDPEELIDSIITALHQQIELEKQQPSNAFKYKGWYCGNCQRVVDASEVTLDDQHQICGRFITHDRPPCQPADDYKALYEQMCERCDVLDKKLAVIEQHWVGLTDEDRKAAFESLPDMLDGFLNKWGWLHFSKAIEQRLKEKNT